MHPILIVDDEKDNLEALQRLLRGLYEVTAITSPFDALKLIQNKEFHVIVSDQRMPEISGVELLEKAKQVAPTSTRVLLTGYTDMDSVIGAINRGQIYRYIAKPWDPEELKLTLKQANEAFLLRKEIESKNAALMKTNAELEAAVAELTLLDQAKASFLSLISHELNTPLTVLNSFVSLLSSEKKNLSPELSRAVSAIEQASDRFASIVAEVLTYVRVSSESKLHLQNFDFDSEVSSILEALKSKAAKKEIVWKWKIKEGIKFSCDAEKMRLALQKLLSESLEQSPPKETIYLELTSKNKELCFTVSRKGDSLSKDALAPFVPGGKTLHHHRNLGLSLALCRLIVESHGGRMEISSHSDSVSAVSLHMPI